MVIVDPTVVELIVPLLVRSFFTFTLKPARVKILEALTVKEPALTVVSAEPKDNPVVAVPLSTIILLIRLPVQVPPGVNVCRTVPFHFSVVAAALAVMVPLLLT